MLEIGGALPSLVPSVGKELLEVLPTVYFFCYLFWDAKAGTVFASFVIISLLQYMIQDQAAKVTSTGMSACDLKEKLDCLKEIQQGKYIIVHVG